MSRYLFPVADYAEDQPLAHTILLTHILARSVTTGAVVGLGIFGAREAAARFYPLRASIPGAPGLPKGAPRPAVFPRLVRVAGASAAWTIGFMAVGTVFRMWGREDIEWRDRSWRLMQNAGQLEVDDWTYGGMALGAALGFTAAGRAGAVGAAATAGWRAMLGAVGLGSVAGTVGYMGWRYGVHGGKFPARV
ncbi:hypothetical protein B0T11DRAFT_79140 [Plectosphaerella cucumerina]|uniref:Uncharacterized protein n=1 Tax=Plectosphaerella cucumerina TaxID=40658 RepID=A0A8K0X2U0_9PEZI|nr:hypothetical protein B0T11DRAFT_79140 [Plectosphaerella cucumerina]